jgi:hypothetical protein
MFMSATEDLNTSQMSMALSEEFQPEPSQYVRTPKVLSRVTSRHDEIAL